MPSSANSISSMPTCTTISPKSFGGTSSTTTKTKSSSTKRMPSPSGSDWRKFPWAVSSLGIYLTTYHHDYGHHATHPTCPTSTSYHIPSQRSLFTHVLSHSLYRYLILAFSAPASVMYFANKSHFWIASRFIFWFAVLFVCKVMNDDE